MRKDILSIIWYLDGFSISVWNTLKISIRLSIYSLFANKKEKAVESQYQSAIY